MNDTVNVPRELLIWLIDAADFAKERMKEPTLRERFERASKEGRELSHTTPQPSDSERLDWLEANPFMAYRQIDPESNMPDDHFTLVDERRGRKEGRRGIVRSTLREAIDAAREGGG